MLFLRYYIWYRLRGTGRNEYRSQGSKVTHLTGGVPQTVVGGDTLVRLQLVNWNS
jgi:hypothetical protein